MTVQLGGVSVNFGANLGPLQSGISSAQGLIGGFGVAAAAAVVGFGVASVQAAGSFQTSMTKISAYAGLSKQQMDAMGQSVLALSGQVAQSPKALADALYPIISSGYSASDALNILKLSAETAAASGAQTSVVADALTTSLGAMHAPASQAGIYMDQFNKIVSLGKGEVPQYAEVIGKLSLAAGSAHVNFGTMGAALADLTTHGFPSVAQASTALGDVFTQMGPKVDLMAAHAKALGLKFNENAFQTMSFSDKLNYLKQITGGNEGELLKLLGGSQLALKAFDALSGSSKDLANNIKQMGSAQGTTADVFRKASDTFSFQMQKLGVAVEVVEVKVGSVLLPILTQVVESITPVISGFGDWITQSNALTSGLDYLSRVLQIFVVPAFHATHMITLAVQGFFQSVADTTSAVTKPSFAQLGETVNTTLNPAMDNLKMLFQMTAQQLPNLTGVTTLQKQAFDALSTTTGPLGQSLGRVNNASTLLGQVFGGVLNSGIQTAIGAMHTFADVVDGPVTQAQQALVDWLGRSSQAYGGLAQSAIAAMGKLANLKMPSLGQISTGGINLGKMLFGDMSNIAPVITSGIMTALGQVAGQLMGKLAGIFAPLGNALKGVLDPLFGFLTAGWQKVVALWNAATAPLVAAWNQIMSAIRPFVAFWQTYIAPIFAEWVARGTPLLKKFIGDVGGIFNDMMNQLRPIFATLGPWFQNTLMPAIKSVLPSIQHFGDAFMEYAFPVVTAIIRVVSSLVVLLASIVVPLFEDVAPRAVKLFGVALDGATKVLIFMKPYVLQALDAVNQFVQWLATNAKPTIDSIFKWLDGVVAGFASLWRTYWPEITLVAEGAWNVIAGSIRGAWLIITGIIKIALDLIQGNWGAAWNDLISTLQGLGGVLIQIVTGLFQIFAGVVAGALLGVTNYFIKMGNDVNTVLSLAWHVLVVDAQTAWNLFWQGLNTFFGGLPNKMVAFGEDIINGLISGIKNMAGLVSDAIHGVIVNSGFGDIAATLHIPGFASGVQNFKGGLALVGENGPELVNLPGGSSVYPLQGGSSGGGSSQGNGDQHIYIMFDGNEMAHYIGKKQQKLMYLHTGVK